MRSAGRAAGTVQDCQEVSGRFGPRASDLLESIDTRISCLRISWSPLSLNKTLGEPTGHTDASISLPGDYPIRWIWSGCLSHMWIPRRPNRAKPLTQTWSLWWDLQIPAAAFPPRSGAFREVMSSKLYQPLWSSSKCEVRYRSITVDSTSYPRPFSWSPTNRPRVKVKLWLHYAKSAGLTTEARSGRPLWRFVDLEKSFWQLRMLFHNILCDIILCVLLSLVYHCRHGTFSEGLKLTLSIACIRTLVIIVENPMSLGLAVSSERFQKGNHVSFQT